MSFEARTPEQQAHHDSLAGAAVSSVGLGWNEFDRRVNELLFAAPDMAAEVLPIVEGVDENPALLPMAHLALDHIIDEIAA